MARSVVRTKTVATAHRGQFILASRACRVNFDQARSNVTCLIPTTCDLPCDQRASEFAGCELQPGAWSTIIGRGDVFGVNRRATAGK